MNFSVNVTFIDRGPCAVIYSLHYPEKRESEYYAFAYGNRFGSFRFKKARDYILESIIQMRDELGVDTDIIGRPEGGPKDFLFALPEKGAIFGTKLRVMSLRASQEIFIFGEAGVKSGRTSSEGEVGEIEARMYAIDRELRRMLIAGEITWCNSEHGFEDKNGKFLDEFTIYVNEDE